MIGLVWLTQINGRKGIPIGLFYTDKYIKAVRLFVLKIVLPVSLLYSNLLITRRYGLLRVPTSSSCGGFCLRPGQKKSLWCCFSPLGRFWCSVVSLVTLRSNLSNFEKIKKSKNWRKKIKISKKPPKKETDNFLTK